MSSPIPSNAPVRIRWAGRVTRILLGVCIALLVAEGAARVLGIPRPPLAPPRVEGKIPLLPLGGDLFVYEPHSSFTYVYDPAGDPAGYFGPGGRLVYRMNRLGFRGPAPAEERSPGTVRILCMGDSYTFGEGVQDEDTYPAQLARLLNAGDGAGGGTPARFEVVNAGVQAFSTRLEAALLEPLLRLRPDVVTLGLFLNDAMPEAETIRLTESARREGASARNHPSRLWAALSERRRAVRRQNEYIARIRASFEPAGWESWRTSLAQMKAMTDRSGSRFVVVIFPVLWNLDGRYPLDDLHGRIEAECKRQGCETLDLLPVFKGRKAGALWAHPTDPHPNREAHRLAAEAIARVLRQGPESISPPGSFTR